MSLTERLQPLFDHLPEEQRAARAAFWQRLRDEGFPSKKHERWRFTDLPGALPDALHPAEPAQLTLPDVEGCRRIAFINGAAEGVDATELRTEPASSVHDASDLVNAALASTGLHWVPGTASTPLHLCTRTTTGSVHLRHRIEVPPQVQAQLYWDDVVEGDADFVTQSLEITLAEGASLVLARKHANTARGPALLRTDARLARDAQLQLTGFDAGSALSRHNLHVRLDAGGAQAQVHGVFAPWAQGHIDTFATVEHAAADTGSRLQFRGLGMDKGVGVLTGRVHVHRDAQRIDSNQQLGSLLLSPRAQINAKPELEIYADDVQCAHGNAIGQIDQDALYYLQTRGVPYAEARALLIGAYAAETLHIPAMPAVEKALMAGLDRALAHADWSLT